MSDLGSLPADLPAFVLGTLVMVLGLGSLPLAIVRRSGRDLLLVSFAAFAGLYGLRLAVSTALARDVVGLSPRLVNFVWVLVTYWIGLPSAVFFSQLGWRRWHPWLVGLAVVWLTYALVATTVDVITGRPGLALGPNPYLVLASLAVAVAAMAAPGVPLSREVQMLRSGGIVLLVFVVNENLGDLGVHTIRRVEPYGFVAFLTVLGYVAASSPTSVASSPSPRSWRPLDASRPRSCRHECQRWTVYASPSATSPWRQWPAISTTSRRARAGSVSGGRRVGSWDPGLPAAGGSKLD